MAYEFQLDFDWSKTVASSKAAIAQIRAELEKLAQTGDPVAFNKGVAGIRAGIAQAGQAGQVTGAPTNANGETSSYFQKLQAGRQGVIKALDDFVVGSKVQYQEIAKTNQAINKQNAVQQDRLKINEAILAGDREELQLRAQARVSQLKINSAYSKILEETVAKEVAAGNISPGTPFQRIQAGIAQRQGRGGDQLAQDYQTGGQFLQSKLLTTAGFAVSGGLFFAITAGAKQAFDETSKLQTEFAVLQQTLQNIGKGDEFDQIKKGLFDTARETGVATSELAQLATQLRGAFSDKSAQYINDYVDAAAKIERVTGLTTAETTDSLTAISKTFGVTGKEIGDVAVGLQQRTGVLAKEIITFSADLAPVAEQAGLSFQKLAAIGASVQQVSGRSGTGLAESIGRVLGGLQDNAGTIVSIYQNNDKLASSQQKVTQALASGQTGKVLEDLIQNYGKLSKAQQNLLSSALGGSRQAPVLAALFGSDTVKKELDRINSGASDVGKLNQQFSKLQGTIGQVLAQLKQTFLQLGVALSETVIPIFKDFLGVLGTIGGIIGPIIRFVHDLDSALGGLGKTAVEVVIAFKALSLLRSALPASLGGTVASAAGGFTGQGIGGAGAGGLLGAAESGSVAGGLGAAEGGAAGAGLARFLPSTTAGGVVLGVGAGVLLVQALASGFQQGVEKEIAKAKQQAPKDALTKKGLEIAEGNAGITKPGFGSIGEVAQHGLNVVKGSAQPEELIQDEYQKAVGAAYIAQIKAVTGEEGFANPKKLLQKLGDSKGLIPSKEGFTNQTLNAVDPTDDKSFESLKKIHDQLVKKYGQDYIDHVGKSFKEHTQKKILNQAIKAGDVQNDQAALDATKADFDTGIKSAQDYIATLNKYISADRALVEAGSASDATKQQYFKARSDLAKILSDQIKGDIDLAQQIRANTGQENSEDNIREAVAALNNASFTDRSDRSAVLSGIFSDYQKILKQRIDSVATAAEKLAIAQQGIAIDPSVKLEIVKVQVQNALEQSKSFSRILKIAEQTGQDAGSIENSISDIAVFTGSTIGQAIVIFLKGILKDEQETLDGMLLALSYAHKVKKSAIALINAQKAQIAATYGALLGALNDPSLNVTPTSPDSVTSTADDQAQLAQQAADEAKRNAEEAAAAARKLATAQANYIKALAGDDPVAAARADIQAAQVEYAAAQDEAEQLDALAHQIQAQRALTTAINAIYQAQADVLKALYGEDPVKVAQIALVQAAIATDNAIGEAAKLEAQAARIDAERTLQKAVFDVLNAQTDLAIAVANSAGDSVKAAQLGLQEAVAKLGQARSLGAGGTELASLQAQIVSQQAALRDAQLQQNEATIDFNLQTEKISTSQAIAQYQALLNNATVLGLTEAQTRDLILKIKGLKDGLSKDLQFDLPTDLRLPTLYEARRLSQTGGNYQDNRQVTITLNSTDPASTEAAVNQITDALNAPSVMGGTGRIY